MANRFVQAFLEGAPEAQEFLPLRFDAPAARREAAARAAERPLAAAVLERLRAQQAALPRSEAREASLEALAAPGTVCVLTGQQVGLFGGPLYSVYKAASAIAYAARLEQETGHRAVPVFWLQTEDHDLPEIATTYAPGEDGPEALGATVDADNRGSVAHLALGEDVEPLKARLRELLEGRPEAESALAPLEAAYRPGRPWAEAFTRYFAEVFAQHGLLFFDPRDPALAEVAAPVHRAAFAKHEAVYRALEERVRALEAAGFSAPVHVRKAPLSFFHPDGPEGPRYRVEPAPEGWRLVGADRVIPAGELEAAIASDPARLSTSALLRPILQDSLLPTAAYVGGPGEVDYFAQLPPLYALFELPPPLVVPRARFTVLLAKEARALEELGLAPSDLARPLRGLLEATAPSVDSELDPDRMQARLHDAVSKELEALRPALEALDPNLGKAVPRTEEAVGRAIGKLLDKYRAALSRAQTGREERLGDLQARLYPNGAPQERVFGLPSFAALVGHEAFLAKVLEALDPLDPSAREIVL